MKCPRCQHTFSATPDDSGIVTCPSCSSRLRTRPAAAAAATAPARAAAAAPASKASPVPAEAPRPSVVTLPAPAPPPGPSLDAILEELQALREGQREILDLLRQQPAPSSPSAPEPLGVFGDDDDRPAAAPPPAAVRSRRRKTVVLIDDDGDTRTAAMDALERAEVPIRAFADGNAALAAIAEEKPDVIVLELGMQGSMGGKDVINMIKATMEWVDVPIILYTRMPIENQREARQIHGADEYVLKGPASAEALVGRVIAVFRRG